MKRLKLLLALALCFVSHVYGQNRTDSVKFVPHWFVSAHGGVQYTLGEVKFGDLLSPAVQVAGGYQFNPWLGARLSVGAWQSKGGWNGYMPGSTSESTTYKYNYVAPAVDVMFNLSNAIWGYNPSRLFNVTAFIGGGANIGFGNGEANDLTAAGYPLRYNWEGTKVRAVGRGGLGLDFRLSDHVSLGLEGNANILSDRYNSKKAGNADWYFNVMAGVTIRIGKVKKHAEATAPVQVLPEPAPREPEQAEPEPVEPATPEPVDTGIRRDVFFKINSSRIEAAEALKIKELAEYLNNHKTSVIEITGYADAGTGTQAINERLSEERAQSVMQMLTDTYNIAPSRIRTQYKGSSVQPFAENDMNRVSICIIQLVDCR